MAWSSRPHVSLNRIQEKIAGADKAKFDELAMMAKAGCPVSGALSAVPIELDAQRHAPGDQPAQADLRRGGRGQWRLIVDGEVQRPSELDLMARLAGMRLRDRWEEWSRQPFTSESSQHVSVWEKPGPLGIRHNGLMDADVVVIGAGALGLSTALHCALAGRSVVVTERHTAGSQASGRAAGLEQVMKVHGG